MKSPYFCLYHSEQLTDCESSALRTWRELMRRGTQAYNACRLAAANIYLNSALDIAQLANRNTSNGMFTTTHLVKPVDLLIQLLVLDNRFDEATQMLTRLAAHADAAAQNGDIQLSEFLGEQYQRVELAEKNYLNAAT